MICEERVTTHTLHILQGKEKERDKKSPTMTPIFTALKRAYFGRKEPFFLLRFIHNQLFFSQFLLLYYIYYVLCFSFYLFVPIASITCRSAGHFRLRALQDESLRAAVHQLRQREVAVSFSLTVVW